MRLSFIVEYEPQWAELLRMNNWKLAILGNQLELGNWSEESLEFLLTDDFRSWKVSVDAQGFNYPLEYKYVIYDPHDEKVIAWENRDNRFVSEISFEDEGVVFKDNELFFDLQMFRGAGVAVPVFSLRSKDGFGIGEFLDLKKMIDWASQTGMRMIQTLPVNDTTHTFTSKDSYPYNSLSVFALHPLYLNFDAMGELKDKKQKNFFSIKKDELNDLKTIDYDNVVKYKWEYFKLIYEQDGEKVFGTESYQDFYEQHQLWLEPYAVFCYLRDKEHTADFSKWSTLSLYDEDELQVVLKQNKKEIGLYFFLQFHLYEQLKSVHDYAIEKGIMLKGDIPIGVSPTSVDVWCNPCLFNLDMQAGAPPDYFSVKGQNWGFPTYNWDLMAEDEFGWWKDRLQYMSYFFDAYRIDHILGFFRIWQIPKGEHWGLMGQFYPAMALKKEDIESYGLDTDENFLLKPIVSLDTLQRYFGANFSEVNYLFFDEYTLGGYHFKPAYDSQQKIYDYFEKNKRTDSHDLKIRDKLLMLYSQVLFVRDHKHDDRYHPRISYQSNDSYKKLSDQEQEGYLRLYEEFFYHRHNEYWKQHAMMKLPALVKSTFMLSCGEDLGMIPATVAEVMTELKILSLEIQRMPKQYGQEFGVPYFAPYMSVCTTSTHDMSPIRMWWEEDRAKTQRYFNHMLFEAGEAPMICEPWIAEKILTQHLQSPAMWVILPIQDWLSLDAVLRYPDPHAERINIPDDPNHVWNYRMHVEVDELLNSTDFNERVSHMVSEGRR